MIIGRKGTIASIKEEHDERARRIKVFESK